MKSRLRLLFILILCLVCLYAGRKSILIIKPRQDKAAHADSTAVIKINYTMQPGFKNKYAAHMALQALSDIVMLGTSHTEAAQWHELLGECSVANRGIGGDVSEGMLYRLNTVINAHPRLCFLECGINDVLLDVPVTDFSKNATAIVSILQQHDITPVLTSIVYLGSNGANAAYSPRIDSFNRVLQDIAVEKNCDVMDLNSKLCHNGVLQPRYVLKDGLHFTPDAYRVWAGMVLEQIKGNNKAH